MKILPTALILLLAAFRIHGCVVPPDYFFVSPKYVINNSDSIVLAMAIEARMLDESNYFRFKTLTNIKGDRSDTFTLEISNQLPGSTQPMGSHTAYDFWTHSNDGTGFDSDCEIRPNFRINHTYLVIESKKATSRRYEEIRNLDDRWLRYVKEMVTYDDKISAIMSETEFAQQFKSAQLFQCPLRGTGRPVHIESLRGSPPRKSPWPDFQGVSCSGDDNKFLWLFANKFRGELAVPVDDGVAYLSGLANGVALTEGNTVSLEAFRSGVDF